MQIKVLNIESIHFFSKIATLLFACGFTDFLNDFV